MYTEINARLVDLQGKLRKKEKVEMQLADFKRELVTIEERLSQLQVQFESEQRDVEKLERVSLTNFFATLSGKKGEKLSKEKQEMAAAQHKLEEAKKTKREIDEEILGLENKLVTLQNTDNEYQQVLLQKEGMIKSSSSPFAASLFDLSEQEGALKAYIEELQEAITAGDRVRDALEDAIASLEEASTWGTVDMFGGGTLTNLVKHQHIDEAEDALHRAQTNMRQFQKELLDIQEQAHLEVDISGMLRFADFFFDGFLIDFMVQGKINDSLEESISQQEKVNDLLLKIKAQTEEKKIELENHQKEKVWIIERLG